MFTPLPISLAQVEHYFADDERLAGDKFLVSQMRKNAGQGGSGGEDPHLLWVPVGVVASFNKMKKLVPYK
jgi:La domain